MEEDNILVKKYIDGDQASLKILIDKYTSSIYNFAYRFTGSYYVEDITQEVFIKVWKNLKSFNQEKSQFKTWLFTIARNTITDYLRKKKMVPFSFMGEEENISENIPDESMLQDELFQKLQDKEIFDNFLNKLPPNYKLVLTLHYQEDMTFKEIGEVLGKPTNTVKSYHYRAIFLLKDILHQSLI